MSLAGAATIQDLDAALTVIADGSMLAIPADYVGVAMAATYALIRRGVRNLHLVTAPVSSLQADLLIGAGAVAVLETSAVGFGSARARGAASTTTAQIAIAHQGDRCEWKEPAGTVVTFLSDQARRSRDRRPTPSDGASP